MKHHRVLALVLALCLCLGIATVASAAPAATSFPDFDSTQWYASAVQAAVENGLLIGDNHGRLRPQDSITRAEMAAVLNRAFGTYKTTSIQRVPGRQDHRLVLQGSSDGLPHGHL